MRVVLNGAVLTDLLVVQKHLFADGSDLGWRLFLQEYISQILGNFDKDHKNTIE